MSKKAYIKKAIEKFVEDNSVLFTDYSNWYVGITGNPERRDREHGIRNIWRSWKADSVWDARDIERFFLDQGMQGNTGGGTRPNYIYVYKKNGPKS